MHYLITAGGTREYIDPVRYISNDSTGQMGYALAKAALSAGHTVTLVSASTTLALDLPAKATLIRVISTADMFNAVEKTFPACDCLIMAAAVSDYTPVRPTKTKIKKSKTTLTLDLKPTVDILAWAASHKDLHRQKIVGFALEDQHLQDNAEKKLKEKNLDMIIANGIEAIGATCSSLWVKTSHADWISLDHNDKTEHAQRIIQLTESLF
jgi:phosphopantothenoylcysteine decarboxylase/phosphopantothenate--cysteine ligase